MSDHAELIERLRACANGVGSFKSAQGDYGICDDAADALAALVAENARLQNEIEFLHLRRGQLVIEKDTARDAIAALVVERDDLKFQHDKLWTVLDDINMCVGNEGGNLTWTAIDLIPEQIERISRIAGKGVLEIGWLKAERDGLSAEVARLREALKEIAHMTHFSAPISHQRDINGIARAALTQETDK